MKTNTKHRITMKKVERKPQAYAARRDISVPPRNLPKMKGPVTRRFWAWPNHLNHGRIVYLDHKRISAGRERVALVRIRNPARVIAKAAKAVRGPNAEKIARSVLEAVGILWKPRKA